MFSGESNKVPGMAVAYASNTPPRARKISPLPDYMTMAGGFFTTASDLLVLMDAVLGGDILSPTARLALMHSYTHTLIHSCTLTCRSSITPWVDARASP